MIWKTLQKVTMGSLAFVGRFMHCQNRASLIQHLFVSGSLPWYVLLLELSWAPMAFPKWGNGKIYELFSCKIRRSSAGSLESQVIIDDVEADKEEHQEITAKTGASKLQVLKLFQNWSVWLCVTTGWLLLLYMLYDYLVFIMIGIFCFCGALAMGHVLFCVVLTRFACTNRYTFKQPSVRVRKIRVSSLMNFDRTWY